MGIEDILGGLGQGPEFLLESEGEWLQPDMKRPQGGPRPDSSHAGSVRHERPPEAGRPVPLCRPGAVAQDGGGWAGLGGEEAGITVWEQKR